MTTVTIDIPTDLYQKLQDASNRAGKSVEHMVQEWLVERASYAEPTPEREQVRAILRAAGLLTELGPALRKRASHSTATLEEVQAAFIRVGGKPLSEVVIEQRGPKI
jgi:hypothetical protein